MKSLFLAIAVTIVFSGCATSVGNAVMKEQSAETIGAQITEGKTTKAEVQKALGSPSKVTFNQLGIEQWTYSYARATPKAINFVPVVSMFARGADVHKKELLILFDDAGRVKKFTFSDSVDEVKAGLLG
jgi:outer membrane protein assembly factor BamE (lipoprotein component of BamABCDE complex)